MTQTNNIEMHRKENNDVVYRSGDEKRVVESRGMFYRIVDEDGNNTANFIRRKREAKSIAQEELLSE
jgi:hypothetical protein